MCVVLEVIAVIMLPAIHRVSACLGGGGGRMVCVMSGCDFVHICEMNACVYCEIMFT